MTATPLEEVCSCAVPEPQQLARGVYCAECAKPIRGAITEQQRYARPAQPMEIPVELRVNHLRPGSRYAMVVLDGAQGLSSIQLLGITEAWRRFVEGEAESLVIDGKRYAVVEVPEGVVLDPVIATRTEAKTPKIIDGQVVVAGSIPLDVDRLYAVRQVAELRAFMAREVEGKPSATEGPEDPVREVMETVRDVRADRERLALLVKQREKAGQAVDAVVRIASLMGQALILLAALLGAVWAWEHFVR